jgi:protein involved in polysaccharide export with SLBB domain
MLVAVSALAMSAMTDQEVINYIKAQSAAGKTEKQIGTELISKGVTQEQVQRIKAKYNSSNSTDATSTGTTKSSDPIIRRSSESTSDAAPKRKTQKQRRQAEGGDADVMSPNARIGNNNRDYTDDDQYQNDDEFGTDQMTRRPSDRQGRQGREEREIYGHSLFDGQALTFEPNENIATPQNYRLGPGDEVIIDIWGESEDHIRETISPEGSIMISQIGPVYLNGKTISDANKHIKGLFTSKYAGVGSSQTEISVTLGQIRTIQVDIMGEVATPGTYRLSPFSTVFHALYKAGGINEIGSMRNIYIMRNGKRLAGVDIYDYLFKGKQTGNVRLQEGDVIIVPAYDCLVNVTGNVKRPMYYEISSKETLKDVLAYAGGFTGDAYSEMVRLTRQTGRENELFNVSSSEFASYRMHDGDVVTIGTILDRYSNRVEVRGSVYRPGTFALGSGLSTVSDLVRQADGLTDDAFKSRVLLYREGDDLSLQVVSLDLGAILAGRQSDITLKKNDVLVISSVHEIYDRGQLTISGEVAYPGTFDYAEGTTIEDLILQAGGLKQGASTARVDVSRRVIDPDATNESNQIARIYSFSIVDGLRVKTDDSEFYLQPYDVVQIRRSPSYSEQKIVTVTGEVLYEGNFALEYKNSRLSDVVKRAGGLTTAAYVKGASLRRQMTDEEIAASQKALQVALANQNGADSISVDKMDISTTYNIGIDLEKALNNPGSVQDLVMKPGDELIIPEQVSTVKISGDVLFPNTVIYQPGKKLKYYIAQSGGYGDRAKKSKAFIVYMNGTVAIASSKNATIEPGCQIIVPSKGKSGTDWTKILALSTSLGSIATMAASIATMFK